MGKNFVSFIRNNYAWLLVTSKKLYSDFDDSPTFAKVNNELVDHTSSQDLKSLSIRNLNKVIVWHLNTNSIRNKFNVLAHQVTGHIDILMISETKLDERFPPGQFFRRLQCSFSFWQRKKWWWYLLFIREDISSKPLLMSNNTDGFFIEINLRNKKKWLLNCSYNPKRH